MNLRGFIGLTASLTAGLVLSPAAGAAALPTPPPPSRTFHAGADSIGPCRPAGAGRCFANSIPKR